MINVGRSESQSSARSTFDGVVASTRAWVTKACYPLVGPAYAIERGGIWLRSEFQANSWICRRCPGAILVEEDTDKVTLILRTRMSPHVSQLDDVVSTIPELARTPDRILVFPGELRLPVKISSGPHTGRSANTRCAPVDLEFSTMHTEVLGVPIHLQIAESISDAGCHLHAEAVVGRNHVSFDGARRALSYPADGRYVPWFDTNDGIAQFMNALLGELVSWLIGLAELGVVPNPAAGVQRPRVAKAAWIPRCHALVWHVRFPGDAAPLEALVGDVPDGYVALGDSAFAPKLVGHSTVLRIARMAAAKAHSEQAYGAQGRPSLITGP